LCFFSCISFVLCYVAAVPFRSVAGLFLKDTVL
jgi:hypothetical protein